MKNNMKNSINNFVNIQTIKLICILLVLLTTSCATNKKVPFTSDIQKQLSENSLKRVQFYTSGKIVLYKVDGERRSASTDKGIILLSSKNSSKMIIIESGTPCSFEKIVGDNVSLFKFEDVEGKVIPFGNTNGGSFGLLAKDWENNIGTIKYADEDYLTNNGDVYLLLCLKDLIR